MAGQTLTSSLIVRLIDQVTAPAKSITKSMFGLTRATSGDFGTRLAGAMERNNLALANTRGSMVDAIAGFYALKTAIGAPIKSAVDFETLLEDIGQKADIPVERLAALGQEIKRVAADTNQATTAIANAVDNLLGRGAAEDVALAAAGPIGKAATAYRAATDDLAAASWSAVDNLKVPADQIGTAIDAMAQAGKEGAFELRDMARFFPSLGAAYQGLGQKGTDAVADLAAALQIVRKGTGDSSTAATNLQNVLQKIGSPATLRAFGKMGVNLRKEMQKAEKAGMTPIEAIAEITNKTLKGDLGKLGFLFEDAQVQAGMRSLIQNMEEYKRIRAEAMKASGVVEKDYQRRIETAAGATIRWRASIENLSLAIGATLLPVMSDLVNRFTPVIDAIGKWTGANPVFTRNVIAATAAVVGFKIAVTGLRYVGLLGRGGALSMMALGYNTVGKAAIFAGRGMKLMAFTPIIAGLGAARRAMVGFAASAAILGPGGAAGIAIKGLGKGVLSILNPLNLVRRSAFLLRGALMFTGVGAVIAGIAAAGTLIYNNWDGLVSFFQGVGKGFMEALAPVRPIMEPIAGFAERIYSAVSNMLGPIKATNTEWRAWGETVGGVVGGAVRTVVEAINDLIAKIQNAVQWAQNLGTSIKNALTWGGGEVEGGTSGGAGGSGGGTPEYDSMGNVTGHRKNGGPVWPGGSFLVGEQEPEVFTPKTAGRITPVSKAGGMRDMNVEFHINGVTNPEEVARMVEKRMQNLMRDRMSGAYSNSGVR
ncbi:phage tail tape measure protein [Agrobacterium salinitolerans]